ncbi:uncharacterized protein BO97DRAFT_191790 [Aspergillus homomorphus CBS 101889]|uniref:Uncharacterized protein n=1 Tax=Aspergillus homomorphus (strain CBS 101889) TaxID=1450537 RepID=A0A395HQ64_ASPHC|nr:hypothetical protein BO97DRAFT_191790 [Aspergillus homomorphus CBS 101889]RAL08998.1 hypothetical protein BO97DRAFT_191790 [Aspergillus homomorphus CBS 101889]
MKWKEWRKENGPAIWSVFSFQRFNNLPEVIFPFHKLCVLWETYDMISITFIFQVLLILPVCSDISDMMISYGSRSITLVVWIVCLNTKTCFSGSVQYQKLAITTSVSTFAEPKITIETDLYYIKSIELSSIKLSIFAPVTDH